MDLAGEREAHLSTLQQGPFEQQTLLEHECCWGQPGSLLPDPLPQMQRVQRCERHSQPESQTEWPSQA